MKVTNCKASGYGDHYKGEHQICAEEYQTQAYKVPLVTEPLDITVNLTIPELVENCDDNINLNLTVVVCNDIKENKCFNVAKLVDATNVVNVTNVNGATKCNEFPLELPTQACF